MKTILTLIAIIFFGTFAKAQTPAAKIDTVTKSIVLNVKVDQTKKENGQVARLYMYKNSRIKKELAFKTKRNRSKLA